MLRSAAIFIWFTILILPSSLLAERLTVFAAASLRGAVEEIAAAYEGQITFSFGGSGTMARQIAAGAPADVVIFASQLWMDWLVDQGRISPDSAVPVASNMLVVIGPKGTAPLKQPAGLVDALGDGRLAMGHRDAVPAGHYARQWLEHTGLWDQLHNTLAETDNVRAALALVARGQAPVGIVYASDALAEPDVDILWSISPASHDKILYPAVALTPQGAGFVALLGGAEAEQVFARHGFSPVRP